MSYIAVMIWYVIFMTNLIVLNVCQIPSTWDVCNMNVHKMVILILKHLQYGKDIFPDCLTHELSMNWAGDVKQSTL